MRPPRFQLAITIHPDLNGYTGAVRDGRRVRHLTDPQATPAQAQKAAEVWVSACQAGELPEAPEDGDA